MGIAALGLMLARESKLHVERVLEVRNHTQFVVLAVGDGLLEEMTCSSTVWGPTRPAATTKY